MWPLGNAALAGEAPTPAAGPSGSGRLYEVDYEANFLPQLDAVQMNVSIRQPRELLRRLRFTFDPAHYGDFEADGELDVAGNELSWSPPAAGGVLRFIVTLDHRRKSGAFDSRMEEDWAVFRGDDLFPPASVTAISGALSQSRLRMTGPDDWSFISAYPRAENDAEWFVVDWPDRRFDRPVGWMAAGRLGVRWGKVAERSVAVAGPMGQGVRHLDLLAFLRWNLPALVTVFPDFPARLLVVSAGDPMWRGGLSGPASLYIHADRPLISGNGTSTLLHELVHVAQGYRAAKDEDWIVESIAEYYTLEIMRRSGTISVERYERGFEKLDQWAIQADGLQAESSSGPRTAKGVAVMQQLDAELRERSHGKHSLDDVARELAKGGTPVSVERLREVAAALVGGPLEVLSVEQLGFD